MHHLRYAKIPKLDTRRDELFLIEVAAGVREPRSVVIERARVGAVNDIDLSVAVEVACVDGAWGPGFRIRDQSVFETEIAVRVLKPSDLVHGRLDGRVQDVLIAIPIRIEEPNFRGTKVVSPNDVFQERQERSNIAWVRVARLQAADCVCDPVSCRDPQSSPPLASLHDSGW